MLIQSQLFLELWTVKVHCRDPAGSAWSHSAAVVTAPTQASPNAQGEQSRGAKQLV